MPPTREDALAIWRAAVTAADPFEAVRSFLTAEDSPAQDIVASEGRVLVCGGGKAGATMAAAVGPALPGLLARVVGLVNVPEGAGRPLQRIHARPARPAGSNHPTREGVLAVEEQLALAATSTPDDLP